MAFHDPLFLFLLLVCFAVFQLAGSKKSRGTIKLCILAMFDAIFYICAGWSHFAILLVAAFVTFVSGLGIKGRHRRVWLVVGLGVNVINLAFFKYTGFIVQNASLLFPVPKAWLGLQIVLPIGISFYTFQLISYLLDVNAEKLKPCTSWLIFWVYISFFAQVIAGPIMRGQDFLPQVEGTKESGILLNNKVKAGILLIGFGLFKKLVIADTLAPFADRLFNNALSLGCIENWLAAYLFAFQIYYDFSAYSDIALGIGRLFGYNLTQNFTCPYLSASPGEFWKRWHITLSNWVRDYLYIPMGGSKKGFLRGCVAALISMAISGLWHGAAWTFIIWGVYHGILVVVYRMFTWLTRKKHRQVNAGVLMRVVNIALFFNLTAIGWVMFRGENIAQVLGMLRKMLSFESLALSPHVMYYVVVVVGLYLAHILEYLVRFHPALASLIQNRWESKVHPTLRGIVYAAVATIILVFLRPNESAFIYFQF